MASRDEHLGRRALRCKHWRWMQGMANTLGGVVWRVYGPDEDSGATFIQWVGRHGVSDLEEPDDVYVPDLTDPATLGCLLALVREAWGDPRASAVSELDGFDGPRWIVYGGDAEERSSWLLTEAHALVAALEAAP